jgi:hypothetical protein
MGKYASLCQATDYITWHMHFACWITKATDKHSEYVILIAFPRKQWFSERASMFIPRSTLYVLLRFIWQMGRRKILEWVAGTP